MIFWWNLSNYLCIDHITYLCCYLHRYWQMNFLNKRTVNITTSFYNFLSSSDGHVLYIIWITVICNWNKHIVKCVVSSRQLCIREVTFKSPVLNPFPELSLFTCMLAIAEFCWSNGRFRRTKRHYYWCAHVVSSKKS